MGLETPTDGFQVRSEGTTIGPGEDLEFCEVAELPGTPDTVECNFAGGDCQSVMDEHSSGAGMAQQVFFCFCRASLQPDHRR